jgi:hypothetical protein
MPSASHVVGVQAPTSQAPFWHVSSAAQPPQLSTAPQPSGTWPQVNPTEAQVAGVHEQALPEPSSTHASPSAHWPQASTLPQPSETAPHWAPCSAHVRGSQA